jgi:putative FmdB family regulatory protein
MPIYEYQCKACNHELEAIQKISEEPLKFCPECGKPELVKQVSAAGFRLKGGGWYETDFKSGDKKKNLAGEGKSDTAAAPAKTETKTETAPAKTAPAGD